jgi:AcrR family transcriptional regulator
MSRTVLPDPEPGQPKAPLAPACTSRGDLRREAIVRAATELFLERGYAGTSIAAVNQRAGGSRTAIYQYFGSKEALFGAIVAQKCGEIVQILAEPHFASLPPRQALTRFGLRMAEIVLAPESIALMRIVIADSARFPELARIFHQAGPAAGRARLADYLAEQQARGTLRLTDPSASARLFADMILGTFQIEALLGIAAPDVQTRAGVVAQGVEAFLAADLPVAKPA